MVSVMSGKTGAEGHTLQISVTHKPNLFWNSRIWAIQRYMVFYCILLSIFSLITIIWNFDVWQFTLPTASMTWLLVTLPFYSALGRKIKYTMLYVAISSHVKRCVWYAEALLLSISYAGYSSMEKLLYYRIPLIFYLFVWSLLAISLSNW